MARDMLLKYCEDPSILDAHMKRNIRTLYLKHSKEIDMKNYIARMNALKNTGDGNKRCLESKKEK